MSRHVCSRCGRYQDPERLIRSAWTKQRYCVDFKQCDKRAARRNAKPKAVTA